MTKIQVASNSIPLNLYTTLDQLEIRKAMYLGNDYNFRTLDAFISGFSMAASQAQLELEGVANFAFFSTWMSGHLTCRFGENAGWYGQIQNICHNDDHAAFNEFFRLLKIFKSSTIFVKTIILNPRTIQFSGSSGVNRFRVINGEQIPFKIDPFKVSWTTISNSTTIWVDYLDQNDKPIGVGFWKVNPEEAKESLVKEFGDEFLANLADRIL